VPSYFKEGTATLSLMIGGATTGITYSRQDQASTRIGDLVFLNST
jgi:hypothetical protein